MYGQILAKSHAYTTQRFAEQIFSFCFQSETEIYVIPYTDFKNKSSHLHCINFKER